eukprot:CAMPEP_0198147416 /NCGR_PEP_ID=MMETSP1443-20131203/35527_1 /TAXON_ID=186043 /ORGANISM="Entomoneis sp., Strain CCMP2396" /LENGTH=649 /DNA_ID=CAMNT_0043811745 /DNA_START=22 /DNA_END=1968 /DNA_ORIENTATION=-
MDFSLPEKRSNRLGLFPLAVICLYCTQLVDSYRATPAFVGVSPSRRRVATSCFVGGPTPPNQDEAGNQGALFSVDEEDGNLDEDSNLQTSPSGFYDIDYEDDALDVASDNAETGDFDGFERDVVEMLEEREDRLYVDEFGIRRKIETCILVGVENVSKRRKQEKKDRTNDLLNLGEEKYEYYAPETGDAVAGDQHVYFTLEESLTEMRELVKTAGMEIVGEVTQRLNEVNPKTYVGTGKVDEAEALLNELGCCTVVFDAELSPGQQKHLENRLNKKLLQNDFLGAAEGDIKVIDRTALILDIFAMHAKTREGKLQVDLALHEYRKPRLTKMWTHLERQSGAGGVGLRGPGESQLEIDKRLLRDRIIVLKQKIDDVQKHRTMHRKGRERMGLPTLALVGYTNSGKSTVLNFLTKAGVMADSMLFATLDPTTRKVKLPGYRTHPEVLLTDTVGFIQKLPTHLVAAFRATLEEVQEADVLVHVIDVSNPLWEKQENAVQTVLADIGAGDKPMVRVLNKIDKLDPLAAERLRYETTLMENTVAISALNGEGLQDFVVVVEESLADLLVAFEAEIPYVKGDEMNAIHEQGNVEVVDYRENGTYVKALVPKMIAERLSKYSLKEQISGNGTGQSSSSSSSSSSNDNIDWVALGRG